MGRCRLSLLRVNGCGCMKGGMGQVDLRLKRFRRARGHEGTAALRLKAEGGAGKCSVSTFS